jgi:hypothetical protein
LPIYTSLGEDSVDELEPDVPDEAPATVIAFVCHTAVGQIVRARYCSTENLNKDIHSYNYFVIYISVYMIENIIANHNCLKHKLIIVIDF